MNKIRPLLLISLFLLGCPSPTPLNPSETTTSSVSEDPQDQWRTILLKPESKTQFFEPVGIRDAVAAQTTQVNDTYQELLNVPAVSSLAAITSHLNLCFQRQAPNLVDQAIMDNPNVIHVSQLTDKELSVAFNPSFSGGNLKLKLAPRETPIVVAIDPGCYAIPIMPSETAAPYQNLMPVESLAVLVEDRETIYLSIACGSQDLEAPRWETPYQLAYLDRDSLIYQLMVNIVSRDYPSPQTQTAIWVVANQITRDDWKHGAATFDGRHIWFDDNLLDASAQILLDSGLDPNQYAFFNQAENRPESARLRELPKLEITESPEF